MEDLNAKVPWGSMTIRDHFDLIDTATYRCVTNATVLTDQELEQLNRMLEDYARDVRNVLDKRRKEDEQ